MHDMIQRTLQTLAVENAIARPIIILCAVAVLYLLALAWMQVVEWSWPRLTLAAVVRIVLLGALAVLMADGVSAGALAARPGLTVHAHPLLTHPVFPTAQDKGFLSYRTLFVAFLTASLWWLGRRLLPVFIVGTVLVMIGRLGIGAHHTVDVLSSVAIVTVAALVARAIPLPQAWCAPVLPAIRHMAATVWPPRPPSDASG